jgi:hypothetical protein
VAHLDFGSMRVQDSGTIWPHGGVDGRTNNINALIPIFRMGSRNIGRSEFSSVRKRCTLRTSFLVLDDVRMCEVWAHNPIIAIPVIKFVGIVTLVVKKVASG